MFFIRITTLPNYRGSIHALRTIFKEEGVRGVYRGYGATLFSFGPFSAFYFLFYEEVCQFNLHWFAPNATDQLKGFISRRTDLDQPTLPFLWTLFWCGFAAYICARAADVVLVQLFVY